MRGSRGRAPGRPRRAPRPGRGVSARATRGRRRRRSGRRGRRARTPASSKPSKPSARPSKPSGGLRARRRRRRRRRLRILLFRRRVRLGAIPRRDPSPAASPRPRRTPPPGAASPRARRRAPCSSRTAPRRFFEASGRSFGWSNPAPLLRSHHFGWSFLRLLLPLPASAPLRRLPPTHPRTRASRPRARGGGRPCARS